MDKIVGRVVTHEKLADSAFNEEDFKAEEVPIGKSVLASPVAASPPASQRRMRRSGIWTGMAGPILPPPSPQ